MRIAVTSQNFSTVTGHGGMSRHFLVFEAQPGQPPVEVQRLSLPPEQTFHAFAGGAHPIDGVAAVLTGSAGAGFVQKLAARGIAVVVTGQGDPLQAVSDWLAGRVTPAAPECAHPASDLADDPAGGGCCCGH